MSERAWVITLITIVVLAAAGLMYLIARGDGYGFTTC